MAQERPDEDVARELMAQALGVPVVRHDDGSQPGMYDIGFTLADGRRGAAEMTSIADPLDRQWTANARYDDKRRIDGSMWAWMVKRRGRAIGLGELMTHLRVLAPLAEERNQTDLDVVVLDPELQHIASVRWFREAKIDVYAFRSTDHPGRVSFTGDNKGAMGDELPLDPLLDWLEQQLTDPAFDADFAKINDSGCEEQHLVLRVDIGNRIPDQLAMALIDRASILPTRRPSIPGRYLTGLWLIPEFGWSAVCWTVDDGWRRAKMVEPDGHD
jgi:hypothetical protein